MQVGQSKLANSVLMLRPELRCLLLNNENTPFYAIEDPANGKFYRLGVREWELVSRLNGRCSIARVVNQLGESCDDAPLSLPEAESVARSLVAAGLAVPVGECERQYDAPSTKNRTALQRVNPFFIRIPLVYPDRWLTAALPWCKWLVERGAFFVWLVMIMWGGYCLVDQWPRFAEASSVYLSPHSWIYLIVVWCMLKVVHEFFHGLVCKKYGGDIGEAGLVLILFSPIAFVDVTSAWRFRSPWRRIATSAAGIYVELFIAAAAAVTYSFVEAGLASQFCHSIILMAGLTTILFNANPLMRFDGYYILSDAMQMQNLYGSGQQFVRGIWRRHFLGLPASGTPRESTRFRRNFVRVYGMMAAMWRVVICVSLLLLAATLFHGAGLAIAALGVVLWVAVPVYKLAKTLVAGEPAGKPQPQRLRFALMSLTTAAVVTAVLCLPWPGGVTAPAVVAYAPEAVVRVESAGFVETTHVVAGQRVVKNQRIATLRNDELKAALHDAALEVKDATINLRVLLNARDRQAEYQAQLERLATLEQRKAHLQEKVDALVVRSPMSGYVLSARPTELVGRFAEVGSPLIKIGSEHRKQLQLEIPEMHLDDFASHVGTVPQVRIDGQAGKMSLGRLARVGPKGNSSIRNAALAAPNGGPLAVRQVQANDEREQHGTRLEFLAPQFRGVVTLSADQATRLRAGQTAKVSLADTWESVGHHAFRVAKSWIERKLSPAAQGS